MEQTDAAIKDLTEYLAQHRLELDTSTDFEAHILRAEAFFGKGQYHRAEIDYTLVIDQADSGKAVPQNFLERSLRGRGKTRIYQSGKNKEAYKDIDRAEDLEQL